MRVGSNPMKDSELSIKESYHRIIIPVYIPNKEGYFAESFDVLKLCIKSLLQTIHDKTLITIINNNSYSDVTAYLRNLLKEKKIDQLIEYQENKGKVDPVVSAMKGSLEPLITVTDCDVLFKAGWQNAVETIYCEFPKVGMVSPLPTPGIRHYYSSWSWFYGLISLNFKRIAFTDRDSLVKFKESVGLENRTLNSYEEYPFSIKISNTIAIIGAGHFCATYNRNVIRYIPDYSSGRIFLGAETLFMDKPIETGGFLRLATNNGFVYHMGNRTEMWMSNVIVDNMYYKETSRIVNIDNGYPKYLLLIRYILYNKITKKLIELFFQK